MQIIFLYVKLFISPGFTHLVSGYLYSVANFHWFFSPMLTTYISQVDTSDIQDASFLNAVVKVNNWNFRYYG